MYGAIIGDLAGSIYEYNQIKKVSTIKVNNIIEENSFYSDDTILTIAILDSMLTDKNFQKSLKEYGLKYLNYIPGYKPYFKTSFSPGFIKWLNQEEEGRSTGNGAMMRISAVGYLSNSLEEVEEYAKLATKPSHNTKEAIECATTIAKIIFLANHNYSKEQIIMQLNLNFNYKPFVKFNSTCQETIDNCLYATFTSNTFEEAIATVISYGGDTDTNACIVGSMAEALYGIPQNLINQALPKLPPKFVDILESGYTQIKHNQPQNTKKHQKIL